MHGVKLWPMSCLPCSPSVWINHFYYCCYFLAVLHFNWQVSYRIPRQSYLWLLCSQCSPSQTESSCQTWQQRPCSLKWIKVTLSLVDRTLAAKLLSRLLLSLCRLLDLVSLAFTSYLRRTGREPVTVSLTIGKYIESHSSGAQRTSLALSAGHW